MTTWRTVTNANDVTEEILYAAEEIYDGWWADKARIDWDEFLYRLEGLELSDGSRLALGNSMSSPAIQQIQAHIKAYRKL